MTTTTRIQALNARDHAADVLHVAREAWDAAEAGSAAIEAEADYRAALDAFATASANLKEAV